MRHSGRTAGAVGNWNESVGRMEFHSGPDCKKPVRRPITAQSYGVAGDRIFTSHVFNQNVQTRQRGRLRSNCAS